MSALAPEAGAIGLIDSGMMYDGYIIVRIVSTSKTMWTVQAYEPSWTDDPEGWGRPSRRKVSKWIPISSGADPAVIRKAIHDRRGRLWDDERALREVYHADIHAIAEGNAS